MYFYVFIKIPSPDKPIKYPVISPIEAPTEDANATKIGGYIAPPAITDTIAGVGKKELRFQLNL